MGDVVELPVITSLDADPARALSLAAETEFTEVLVIGVTSDGEFYFRSSVAGSPENVWMLNRALHKLMVTEDALET